jgi:uncharacterized protein (DUF305 family)
MMLAASAATGFLSCPARAQQADSTTTPVVVQPGAPGKPSRTLPPSTRGTLPHPSQADVEFMQGMIMHHSQAVEMTALIPSHTQNKDVQSLGARISRSQSDEIKFMQRWLAAHGEPVSMAMPEMPDMDKSSQPMALMPGMLTPEQMEALRNAKGAEFDKLFLMGMIQHHNGALIMVKDLFDSAGAGQVRTTRNAPRSGLCSLCWKGNQRRNNEPSAACCFSSGRHGRDCFVFQCECGKGPEANASVLHACAGSSKDAGGG